jgi:hypothetical protein
MLSRMRFPSLLVFTALGVLSGCANQGALGQSAVTQGCPPSDPGCTPEELDGPVAMGASVTLTVSLALNGGGAPPLTLVSGDEGVFTVSGQTLTGVGPGFASLLFAAEESVVLDFTSVWVQQASDLALTRRAEDGTILGAVSGTTGLLVGDSIWVSASALSNTQPLVGLPPATWSADPAVVTILDEGIAGRTRVVARAPGMTTVTVAALGLEAHFDVEVTP